LSLGIAAVLAWTAQPARAGRGAQEASPPSDETIAREARALVEAHGAAGLFSGAVLVARRDRVLYAGATGAANLEAGTANTADTPFRIVGITQLFTAAAILRLEEQGRLKVTDTIGALAPAWPEAYHPITVHQLLVGESGVKDVTQIPEFVRTVAVPRDTQELAGVVLREPPAAAPGTWARASNSNYHLLAALIERVSGTNVHEFVRREVIERAGLRHTQHDDPAAVIPGRAAGYLLTPSGLRHAAWFHMSNATGMANLSSTVSDVHRFFAALLAGRIVPAASVERMLTPHVSPRAIGGGATSAGIGYGINILDSPAARILTSGTNINGASANLHHNLQTGVTIVVLSNVGASSGPFSVLNGLVAIASGREVVAPVARVAVPPRAEDLAALAGNWERLNAFSIGPDGTRRPTIVTFRAEGQRLFGRMGGGPEWEWFSSGPGEFFARHVDEQIRIRAGSPDVVEVVTSGRVSEMRRQKSSADAEVADRGAVAATHADLAAVR
jgi:CubicO group peptidase (beta-lactamase class C family)